MIELVSAAREIENSLDSTLRAIASLRQTVLKGVDPSKAMEKLLQTEHEPEALRAARAAIRTEENWFRLRQKKNEYERERQAARRRSPGGPDSRLNKQSIVGEPAPTVYSPARPHDPLDDLDLTEI